MDFLDKIGNIAKNIGDRTNDAIEITKLNAKISSEKNAAAEELNKIGDFYYKKLMMKPGRRRKTEIIPATLLLPNRKRNLIRPRNPWWSVPPARP